MSKKSPRRLPALSKMDVAVATAKRGEAVNHLDWKRYCILRDELLRAVKLFGKVAPGDFAKFDVLAGGCMPAEIKNAVDPKARTLAEIEWGLELARQYEAMPPSEARRDLVRKAEISGRTMARRLDCWKKVK